MSRTSPDGQLDLDPHEYRKIVAPLRREKPNTPAPTMFSLFWFLMLLLLWQVGERMAENVGEAVYSRLSSFGTR